MKRTIGAILAGLITITLVAPNAFAQYSLRGVRPVSNGMGKDPDCQKYFKFHEISSGGHNVLGYVPENVHKASQCTPSLLRCEVGWNAASGQPDQSIKQWFIDSLAPANWAGHWHFKFLGGDPHAGTRATYAMVLFDVKNGADLIANSISTKEKFIQFWAGPRKTSVGETGLYPYLALYYLGAQDKADLMIDGLDVVGQHQMHFLNVAHFWNLTPAQIAKIEATCLKIIAEPRGNNQTKRSCMRYLSRVGSKSTDLREHLMTFASNSSTYEGMDAVRALGILKHKPAIAQLKPEFMRANLVRTVSVRKGRKTTQVKQSTWVGNDNITNLAVALADMGDRDAMPAINYYLSTNEQGLVEDRGFSALVFEATLASPAMQKRLIPLIKATLKKLVGVIGKNSSAAREYRYAHMALLQMGDKDGYSFIMKVLEGHDKDAISETLQQLGGMLTPLASGPRGIQRIKVGKGAISPSDANNMLQLIQKRMRFWPDKKVKEYATRVILELMGAIKAGTR